MAALVANRWLLVDVSMVVLIPTAVHIYIARPLRKSKTVAIHEEAKLELLDYSR